MNVSDEMFDTYPVFLHGMGCVFREDIFKRIQSKFNWTYFDKYRIPY